MTERTPLLHYRLAASVNDADFRPPTPGQAVGQHPGSARQRSPQRQPQKLSVFFGVVIPTLLSMFSVVVFLRIGEFENLTKVDFMKASPPNHRFLVIF